MSELAKRHRRCWIVQGYAPDGSTMREANDALNAFVADPARGLVLFHDHYSDRPGGVAIFAPESEAELAALREPGPLADWDHAIHPLIFSEGKLGFLFQVDYTMIGYRQKRLPDLFEEYAASELGRRNAEREIDG